MQIGLIIVGVILLLVIILLFTGIEVVLDTNMGYVSFSYGRFVGATLLFSEKFFLQMKIFFWQKQIDLQQKKQKAEKKIKNGTSKGRKKIPFRKLVAVLKSFRVRESEITMDTGNMPLNGILYPIVFALRKLLHVNVSINFWGEEKVFLRVRNNLARILYAYFKN